MNSNKNLIIGAIVLVAIVLIGWLVLKDKSGDSVDAPSTSASSSASRTASPTIKPSVSATPKAMIYTVHLTAQGVVPQTLTIRKGDAVTFKNDTTTPWWPTSSCSGFDSARGLGINEAYTLTFGTKATCTYRNHLDTYNTTSQGTIVIQ